AAGSLLVVWPERHLLQTPESLKLCRGRVGVKRPAGHCRGIRTGADVYVRGAPSGPTQPRSVSWTTTLLGGAAPTGTGNQIPVISWAPPSAQNVFSGEPNSAPASKTSTQVRAGVGFCPQTPNLGVLKNRSSGNDALLVTDRLCRTNTPCGVSTTWLPRY